VEAPIDEDNHGLLFLNSRIRVRDIPDGTSYTIFLGETADEHPLNASLDNLGWMSGTRATLRNTGLLPKEELQQEDELLSVGGFGSYHTAGLTMFAFGDGHVRPLSPEIDPEVYRSLGNRADGKLIDPRRLE
jgi:prepilin-type processing-associated H-X9-DG protein